jgi:MFS family permease
MIRSMNLGHPDLRVIGTVASAHGLSHFFQLVLPPLFPAMKDEFGVGYAELGAMMGVFFAVSGIAQFAAGYAVDRFGAQRVLVSGMALLAGATLLVGFAPNYWTLLPLAAMAGLGNAVFHPADFAVLNARVDPSRLGRAYGAHGLAGNLGWVLAPIFGVALSKLLGWREAVVIMGAGGLVAAALLHMNRQWISVRVASASRKAGGDGAAAPLLSRPVIMCFGYFALLSTALVGLQSFSVPATMAMFGLDDTRAAQSLTLFLVGSSVGIVVGAILADRTAQHHRVAATGLILAAALIALAILQPVPPAYGLPVFMALAGLCVGATGPSRDSIVRRATPRGASGRVYGFVYSGLDLGSIVAPGVFGIFVDMQRPVLVYVVVIVGLLLAVGTVIAIRDVSVRDG